MGILWCGGGGGSVLRGGNAAGCLLTAVGVLRKRVASAQDHVHILVDWDRLEHLHNVSVSLPQHTGPIDVHDHIA